MPAKICFSPHGLSGRTDKREDWINLARRTPRQFIARKVSSQAVEIHGDAALVLGRLDVRRLPNASANETKQMCYDLKYVHLYLKRNGRWQWVSHQDRLGHCSKPLPREGWLNRENREDALSAASQALKR